MRSTSGGAVTRTFHVSPWRPTIPDLPAPGVTRRRSRVDVSLITTLVPRIEIGQKVSTLCAAASYCQEAPMEKSDSSAKSKSGGRIAAVVAAQTKQVTGQQSFSRMRVVAIKADDPTLMHPAAEE